MGGFSGGGGGGGVGGEGAALFCLGCFRNFIVKSSQGCSCVVGMERGCTLAKIFSAALSELFVSAPCNI